MTDRIDLEALRAVLINAITLKVSSTFDERQAVREQLEALVAVVRTHLALDAAQHELDAAHGAFIECEQPVTYQAGHDVFVAAEKKHQKAMEAARGALARFEVKS